MKLLALLLAISLPGCVITGSYTDPESGASVNISQTVDAKTIKRLRDLR